LEREIETLELSQKAGMPELLTSLRGATEELKAQLVTFNRIDTLEKENNNLKVHLKSVTQALDEAQKDSGEIRTRLADVEQRLKDFYLESETFTLKKDTSKSFAGYGLVVGVKDVKVYEVIVVVNNVERNLSVGGSISSSADGKTYSVILDQFDFYQGTAGFTIVAKKAKT
jgi:hypothetical protein